jgi:hypothetical protein
MEKLFSIENDKLDLSMFLKVIKEVNKDRPEFKDLIIVDNKLVATDIRYLIYKDIDIEGKYIIPNQYLKKVKSIKELKTYLSQPSEYIERLNFKRVTDYKIENPITIKCVLPKVFKKCEYGFFHKNNIYIKYDYVTVSKHEFIISDDFPDFEFGNFNLLSNLFSDKEIKMTIDKNAIANVTSRRIIVEYDEYKCILQGFKCNYNKIHSDFNDYYSFEV